MYGTEIRGTEIRGTEIRKKGSMRRYVILGSSTAVAAIIATALFLRPSRTIWHGAELATPDHIAPAARSVIHSMMTRHPELVGDLVTRVILLDYDGVARTAGDLYDEPALAKPIVGDELNSALPARFFDLQKDMRDGARRVVEAAARKDGARIAEDFAALTRTCIGCHDLYLHTPGPDVPNR
jgi:hypothetical protein